MMMNPKLTRGSQPEFATRIARFIREQGNFYRLHLCAFIFIPLIFSCIFYASNGRFHIRFIDAVFLCYSAMTDTGLSTVNLSTLTVWQQVILYIQMAIGNATVVAWIMVLVRKQYFRTKCHYIATLSKKDHPGRRKPISSPLNRRLNGDPVPPRVVEVLSEVGTPRTSSLNVDNPHVDSTSERQPISSKSVSFSEHFHDPEKQPQQVNIADPPHIVLSPVRSKEHLSPNLRQRPVSKYQQSKDQHIQPTATLDAQNNKISTPAIPGLDTRDTRGDFLGPVQIMEHFFKRLTPSTYRKFERTMTIPRSTTLDKDSTKWLNFDRLVVGRNSDFRTDTLSDDQLEQLGGTEYRALRLLSYLVPAYFVITQLISFLVFAPWLSATKKYDSVFENQYRYVPKPWYSLFVIMSAYTGTGLDLVDLSMLPFQEAYLMIFSLIFILLAGNHALPIFLRLIIWVWSRFTKDGSEIDETLSFLLHHPRRCFMLLFPSHQTWFLLIVLAALSALEWTAFGILNLGLPIFESLPVGPRVISGLFQGIAVRASGLTIVPIVSLAPALIFLYVVLMYIAVYPVAMCIRATNVYEERSLGIFEVPIADIAENLDELEPRERVGRYLGWHLRRQLSLDIWWLVWGIFFIAIIERKNIMDPSKPWFNLYAIIFELVSAFGSVGLSLGFPNDNFSLVGDMSTLSKLVITVLMIRGRHRGLPVAVDRAVLLPSEMVVNRQTEKNADDNEAPVMSPEVP